MSEVASKMTFDVVSRRVDGHGSVAECKDATLTLDTALAGRRDALNPAELLLAALSACMIKGIERVAPMHRLQHGRSGHRVGRRTPSRVVNAESEGIRCGAFARRRA